MKTKGKREKQNPAHRPKHNVRHQKNLSLCFPREKSKQPECCLTIFSNQIWKVRQLCDFPSRELSGGSQWTAEAEAAHEPLIPMWAAPTSPFKGTRRVSTEKFSHTHTHPHTGNKEDAIDLPVPSLTLPVLTMALNEPLKLNYFIKVYLQS